MVKVKNPFAGIDASGKLADVLAFASTKRGGVAGRKRVPAQPRTGPQLATRYYMRWLSTTWAGLSIAELASWNAPNLDQRIPAYNRFVRYNIDRFKHLPGAIYWVQDDLVYPAAAYPADQATNGADFSSPAVTNGTAKFTLTFTGITLNDNWMWTVHQATAAEPNPVYINLLDAWQCPGTVNQVHVVDPAPIGAYTIRMIGVSRTGKTRLHYRSKSVNVSAP